MSVVSYDTKTGDGPAPRPEGAPPEAKPVRYGDMLAYLHAAVKAHEGRIEGLVRLLADERRPAERATLQAMIERETLASERAAGTARVIWLVRANDRLRDQVRHAAAVQRGDDDAGDDYQMRYE